MESLRDSITMKPLAFLSWSAFAGGQGALAAVSALLVMAVAPAWAETGAAPPVPTAPPPASAATPEKQTGAAAWAAIVGNTIEGKVAGQDFSDYFDKGGGVRHVDQNGLSSGTWTLQGDKVCLDYPDDDERSCMSFEVAGTSGTALDDDGNRIRFTIEPGNSKGL